MENQLTNNANALRLFFTEEVFLVKDETVEKASPVVKETDLSPKNNVPNVNVSTEAAKPYPQVPANVALVEEPASPKTFKFLGGNKKSVLILVNDKQHEVSSEQGRDLLRKIVKAVDLGSPDFAVLNYAGYAGTDFAALREFFKPVIMLSFGVEISELKLDLIWQNEIIIHETTKMIFAPNLHQLDGDIAAKKLLWGNLQKIK